MRPVSRRAMSPSVVPVGGSPNDRTPSALERVLTRDRPMLRAIPITVVLTIVAVALVLISLAYWRRGAFALGMAMLLAGVLRAVLSDRTIGVLAVRGKKFDLLFYFGAAAVMVLLTVGINT